MIQTKFKVTLDPQKVLQQFCNGLKNKAMRIAMNKAAAPVKAAVVSNAPSRYGFLRASIRIKVRQYKNSQTWVAVIGPKSDFVKNKGKVKTGEHKGKPVRHKPSSYAPLVDKGTKYIKGDKFLEKALTAEGKEFINRVVQSLQDQVKTLLPQKK